MAARIDEDKCTGCGSCVKKVLAGRILAVFVEYFTSRK